MKRKLAFLLMPIIMSGLLVGCGEKEVVAEEEPTVGIYTDGLYEGVGKGFKGDIKLSVQIENGNILDIEILEMQETVSIGDVAIEKIIEKIIAAQSTEVDTVSGATISSQGTMNAVKIALDKAK